MEKKRNNKGFTLAELLIVVAIIAVLVAVAIPVFTNQLEKSREATDVANVRSAYAEVMTKYLENGSGNSMTVAARQKVTGWQTSPQPAIVTQIDGSESSMTFGAKTSGNYTVTLSTDDDGDVTLSIE